MAANMTTPNQLMELPHPQSHDDATTQTNCERFVDDDKLAALSKGVYSSSRYGQVCKVGFDHAILLLG